MPMFCLLTVYIFQFPLRIKLNGNTPSEPNEFPARLAAAEMRLPFIMCRLRTNALSRSLVLVSYLHLDRI